LKANIIQIGNSKGIRLPKAVMEQCGLRETVELEVKNNRLVVRPADTPRANWERSFAMMREQGEDTLLDGEQEQTTEWDNNEWDW